MEMEHKLCAGTSWRFVLCDEPWIQWFSFMIFYEFHSLSHFKMGITCMWPSSPFLINIMDSDWFFNYWCRQFPVICSLIDTQSLCIHWIEIVLQRNSTNKYSLNKSDHNHDEFDKLKKKQSEKLRKNDWKNKSVQ